MLIWKHVFALVAGFLVATCLGSVAGAGDYGPTDATKDLQAIIAAEPAIAWALTDSLARANYNGVDSLDDFYDYVDRTIRLVPTSRSLLEEVRPFFHLVGQSDKLRNNAPFLDWVKRYVASYGKFLDSTASAAGLQTFYDDPAFRIDDYAVGPSEWMTFNQFFAREIMPGKRPIAGRGDGQTIVAGSDGTFRGLFPVDGEARIVVKGIGYSIAELLKGSRYADAFAGGRILHSYQGVTDYQWRQERGILVLETEEIGLVAIVPVGMGLVGGVVLTPDEGADLHKGEEFGFFQFGGSDVMMVFQKDRLEITAVAGQC